jgi:hypothetical protein
VIHAQKASWRSTCEGEARQEATTVEGSAILHYGSPCIAHHLEWRVSEAVAAHDAFHDYSEFDVDDGISVHTSTGYTEPAGPILVLGGAGLAGC